MSSGKSKVVRINMTCCIDARSLATDATVVNVTEHQPRVSQNDRDDSAGRGTHRDTTALPLAARVGFSHDGRPLRRLGI